MEENVQKTAKRQMKWPLIWIGYLAAFLFLSNYDLQASMFLTSHQSKFVIFVGTHISILPAGLIAAFCGTCLYHGQNGWKRNLPLAISIIGSMVVSFYIFQPNLNLAGFLLVAAAAIPVWILMRFIADHADVSTKEARNTCIAGILLVISAMAATSILKMIWGRPRFISLEDPLTDFVPWYKFNGFNASNDLHKSFPSGHTTAAATILWITMLPHLFPSLKGKEKRLWIIAIVWIAIAAFSRIMAGMHYISDTMGAFAVALGFFLYYRKRFFPGDDRLD